MRPVVNLSEEGRATDIGNMHKNGKNRACDSEISSLTDRQSNRQTYSSQYFATAPAGEVITECCTDEIQGLSRTCGNLVNQTWAKRNERTLLRVLFKRDKMRWWFYFVQMSKSPEDQDSLFSAIPFNHNISWVYTIPVSTREHGCPKWHPWTWPMDTGSV